MVVFLRENGEAVKAEEVDEDILKALNDPTRRDILETLSEKPFYPSKVADELGISKQKTHYHFQILSDAGIIKKFKEEKRSGGLATYYKPSTGGFVLDLGGKGEKTDFKQRSEPVKKFLEPLIENGRVNGKIVVGSPDRHGPDQVRARDNHLSGEIGMKLGGYASCDQKLTVLDTELVRETSYNQNLLLLGGILTNTVSKKFNQEFPVKFEGENFPYREIKTRKSSYSQDSIGVIAKTSHPEDDTKTLLLVAGVRHQGTQAAVQAFKNIEELIEEYRGGDCYIIVEGKDMDGDGEIDDYDVLEKEGVR